MCMLDYRDIYNDVVLPYGIKGRISIPDESSTEIVAILPAA